MRAAAMATPWPRAAELTRARLRPSSPAAVAAREEPQGSGAPVAGARPRRAYVAAVPYAAGAEGFADVKHGDGARGSSAPVAVTRPRRTQVVAGPDATGAERVRRRRARRRRLPS
ncbi:hypothetical protein ACP70R_022809 [Stipagrostis hirtigluma subsp. patula]